MNKIFYVTTPIYYVNDKPHIGHAYTSLACDMVARFKRLDGYRVKFLTGTDEHGQKVAKTADIKGLLPQEFVDEISQNFRGLSTILNLTNDDFIRTTEERHKKAVCHLWQTLIDKGQIYLGEYSGWYAIRDESFYSEDELIDGKAPTGAEVEWLVEPSYFFKLSEWEEPLLKFYSENPDFIKPEGRRNEVISFVKSGLRDLSVSRSSLKWGIPVPNDPTHVIYVWLDALTNYIAAIGYPDNLDQGLWNNSLHIVGKDILKFHAVYWSAFLMAAEIKPPLSEFAHGWWTNEGEKISKSLGNVIDPLELVDEFGSDAVRYFLLREVSFGQDGNFSKLALINRLNSDLANSYGNLVQRVLSFVQKNCNGKIPVCSDLTHADQILLQHVDDLLEKLRKCIDNLELHHFAENIWQAIFAGNKYVDEQKPWVLKNNDVSRMNTVIYVLISFLKKIAILTQPILPLASAQILNQLGIPESQSYFNSIDLSIKSGDTLPIPQPIFNKV